MIKTWVKTYGAIEIQKYRTLNWYTMQLNMNQMKVLIPDELGFGRRHP